MKRGIYYFVLFLGIMACASCNKPKPAAPTAIFVMTVNDTAGKPIQNATINLYKTQIDYLNNTNVVVSKTTNSDGAAKFSDLEGIVYYYYVTRSSDCSDNSASTNHTAAALSTGFTNTLSVTLTPTGNLNFTNSSVDPYNIYINNSYWNTIEGGQKQFAVVTAGAYAIEVKQISGFTTTPVDQKFNKTVSPCGSVDVKFP